MLHRKPPVPRRQIIRSSSCPEIKTDLLLQLLPTFSWNHFPPEWAPGGGGLMSWSHDVTFASAEWMNRSAGVWVTLISLMLRCLHTNATPLPRSRYCHADNRRGKWGRAQNCSAGSRRRLVSSICQIQAESVAFCSHRRLGKIGCASAFPPEPPNLT